MTDTEGTRVRWLEERQGYIGSSDIARLLRIAPDTWGGPYAVWREKTHPVDDYEFDLGDRGYWGLKLEPLIALRYGEFRNCEVRPWSQDHAALMPSEDHAHCACTPDWYAPAMQQGQVEHVIECKTVSSYQAGAWGPSGADAEDAVPPHYIAQVRWQMGVLGMQESVICALIGGNDWRWYDVFQDQEWFDEAAHMADAWYEWHVLNDHAPEIDQRNDIILGEDASALQTLVADDGLEALLQERASFKAMSLEAAQSMKAIDLQLCGAMGTRFDQVSLRDGQVGATWKVGRNGKRRLLIKELKD